MTIFIPSNHLVRIARSTLQVLATIASFAAIVAALALACNVLIWACSVLVLFIHALSGVCQATFSLLNGNYVAVAATFITWALLLICIKLTCVLLPSIISFFGVQEVRV